MSFLNIRPLQEEAIPWGWKNEVTSYGIFVVEHPGEIKMPNLVKYFNWNRFEAIIPSSGIFNELGTRDMKSIFTTAIRFLGWERAWINLEYNNLDLTPITDAFLEWNKKLLSSFNGNLRFFMIGDEYGYNNGLFTSLETWRKAIKPHLRRMMDLAWEHNACVVMHSDGDIFELLDDFDDMGVYTLNYQPVGRMKAFEHEHYYKRMRLWKNVPDLKIKEYKEE